MILSSITFPLCYIYIYCATFLDKGSMFSAVISFCCCYLIINSRVFLCIYKDSENSSTERCHLVCLSDENYPSERGYIHHVLEIW